MTATNFPALVVNRHIRAEPQRVFQAWTTPHHLTKWWGPPEVECTHAEVDLRIGGTFRLANRLPSGDTMWIAGVYEEIDPPHRLQHTWYIEADPRPSTERVTVDFVANGAGTDITITHRNITSPEAFRNHENGWFGCLDGLDQLLT